jgi:alkylation response protein AidB-like acyl-CoA dehydrogenase
MDVVERARQIADEVLFPAALATDASDVVPRELLDTLAEAGLYGRALDVDFPTVCAVQEELASGCLTTAFLWAQHVGLLHAVSLSGNEELRGRWLEPLAAGEVRAGLALGGALPQPALHARADGDGWLLDGVSPFVSGWGRIDVVHTAARAGDEIVWLIVDAQEGAGLGVERLRLAALDATATVRASFDGLAVPGDRVTGRHPAGGPTPPEVLRMHAALALGVTSRCCRLLGATPLGDELIACRAELDRLDPETIFAARAAAGELAVRAAAALSVAQGSRSLLVADHAQRLTREALFTLVYALRPASRDALLARLHASDRDEPA